MAKLISRRSFLKGMSAIGASLATGTFFDLNENVIAEAATNSDGIPAYITAVPKGTPHISAAKGEIAERILLSGDPLRAKFIAENFLENPKQYTSVRNIFGYTGTYKGVPISVQGTGMGMPSISIYVHELINEYGVKKLFRVGTCGGMHQNVKLRDVIIAQGASTDSGMVRNIFGSSINFAPLADYELLSKAVENTKKLGLNTKVGNIITVDRFYDKEIDSEKLRSYGILAVEMETAALYLLAAQFQVQALAILTVSDHLLTHESTNAEERQTSFNDMVKIALETAVDV
ncbi:MAG TPA: purine-nucleoside phosphorylase [Selenomonas sp.]|nr:purine-nucleoside phosphorylase [Selenomonas sp.]